jgi:hypothetical protein
VAARGQGLAVKGHSAYYRFLSRARWSVDATGHVLFRLLLSFLPERIEAAVDDTLCHRSGPHLFGAGMFHDAARSTYGGGGGRRVSFAFGHNWVILSVRVPLPWNRERGLAVPVLFRLYRSKRRCPESQYRKRTELAGEMLGILRSWLPQGRKLDLAGDGEYACRTLLQDLPEDVTFTGPMAMDAALFEPVRCRRGGRGRPRLKGERLPCPTERAQRGEWRPAQVTLHGRSVSLLLQTWTCLWYTVTGLREVRVVLTRDPKGRWKDRAYFCTDPRRPMDEILTCYANRWQLEVTIQMTKQTLGLEEPRNGWWRHAHGRRADGHDPGPKSRGNRGRKAVERTVPLIFLTYGLVAIWFLHHGDAQQQVQAQRRRRPWYGLKGEPAYTDMLAAMRHALWAQRISRHPSLRPHRAKILRLIAECAWAA